MEQENFYINKETQFKYISFAYHNNYVLINCGGIYNLFSNILLVFYFTPVCAMEQETFYIRKKRNSCTFLLFILCSDYLWWDI